MAEILQAQRPPAPLPTIICLHATGGSGAQWTPFADWMRLDFRVLTPDLYGHGALLPWNGDARDIVAADTRRVARLAAAAGGDVHLVGHSYGGAIALRVALYHPELVASVAVYEPVAMRILFDYNRRHRAAAEVAAVADTIRRELKGGDATRAARRFLDYWSGDGSWERLAPERQTALARRMPVVDAHFASLFGDAATLRDYRRLDAPVLLMTGRETRASARRIGELLRFALPHAESVTFEAIGHLGPVTHAATIAQQIARFIRRMAASATPTRKAA
ncbi:MAG TPA: alpha/beta hydrolase [Casimicrobiaceae bacterium]